MTNNILGFSKQILCADGHQDTCSLVSYLLKPFGYKVTTVNDMSNGLRIARAGDYDLYMIACKLSDGTGVELCEKLREFDQQTPILFWSARVYESEGQRALEAEEHLGENSTILSHQAPATTAPRVCSAPCIVGLWFETLSTLTVY